ncbi:DUF2484 family protein [Jannaschia rubra]|uniref:DUF2484 family protein n=1 Tax=Jannaschia rubra TaxID=282197 RepID=A0A0M6XQV3_9RHOB|nr:DUF2484 family protein [Jannaschia rubra]CTQ32394.1 hypothetical protein JAN5088_01159 [Jannaschia rubra]SFG45413.1 Protein of unknown function [Jannaschia rubra]
MAGVGLCLWVVAAWVLMVTLRGRQTWYAAGGLIVTGVPLLVWLGRSMGAGWLLVGVAVLALVLRWPLRYALRWARGLLR